MSEMPRLIWTSDPDIIAHGELTVETKLRREFATILIREAAKRNKAPVEVLMDIIESVLMMIDLPEDSSGDDKADVLMERLWG